MGDLAKKGIVQWEDMPENTREAFRTRYPHLMEFSPLPAKPITLEQLHKVYKKELYIEDTDRIDVVLAVALSSKLEGIPLWLILVGPSGDMKSVQLNALEGLPNKEIVHNLTAKTLVNGHADKTKYPDLAPALNGKIVLIPDMAQILKLPPNEKGELWGQLRDLYDGYAGKNSGMGSTAKYKGLKVTLIAGSTPAIDGQILVHQDLGTRELIYRTSGNKNKEKVMQKCFDNEESEKDISNRLKSATTQFLLRDITDKTVSQGILNHIMTMARYTSCMRTTAEFDNYTNELRNYAYPEEPTRIAKQLKRLYICLKNLDKDYSDETAIRILWHVAKSCAFPLRIKVFEYLSQNKGEFSTSQLSELLRIGKSTTKRECAVLENMGLIKCRRQETSHPNLFYEYWSYLNNSTTDGFPVT